MKISLCTHKDILYTYVSCAIFFHFALRLAAVKNILFPHD